MNAFEKASLAGKYYESFNVNSKNCMEKSTGTKAWIADCHRLLNCCVAQEKKGDPADVRQAFEIVFRLLDRIDQCLDDVIFFADEAGSWQVVNSGSEDRVERRVVWLTPSGAPFPFGGLSDLRD